jgi:hypothetical protein
MMTETTQTHSPARETIYLTLALLPPITLVALLLWGVWEQFTAAQYVEAEIASLKGSVEPVDNVKLVAAQRDQASIDGARDWNDLSVAIGVLDLKYGEAFRVLEDNEQLKPAGEDWSAKPIAELYSAEAAPLIERMQTLLQRDRTQPGDSIYWNGSVSHYSGNWLGDDLLLREFRLAYHNRDPERAADLLELYIESGQKMWGGVMMDPLSFIIHRSLEHEFWTAETLMQVQQTLSDRKPTRTSWADQVTARRVDLLTQARMSEFHEGVNPRLNDSAPYGIAATHVARYLQFYDELETLPGYGSREHYWAVEDVIAKMNAARAEIAFESMVAVPIATVDSLGSRHYGSNWSSNTLMSRMHDRRLRTAIAIKQFQLQEHRWPASLAELTRVGLAASDWKLFGDIDFGYGVDADGQTARLWRAAQVGNHWEDMLNKNFQLTNKPPSEMVLRKENIQAAETAIR